MSTTTTTAVKGFTSNKKVAITIPGLSKPNEPRLFAMSISASTLPGQPIQQCSLFITTQLAKLEISALTGKKITVTYNFKTEVPVGGPYEFIINFIPHTIVQLPHKNMTDYFCYRIDCGYPDLTLPQLAARRTRAYSNSPKDIIKQTLLLSALPETDFNIDGLTSDAFCKNAGWYLQTGQTTQEFIHNILAANGGIMLVDREGMLRVVDTAGKLAAATTYEIPATIHPANPNSNTPNNIEIALYRFQQINTTPTVNAVKLGFYPTDTKTDLRPGDAKFNDNKIVNQLFGANDKLDTNGVNKLAENLLEADTFATVLYRAVTSLPLHIGDSIKTKVKFINDEQKDFKLVVVAVNGVHSFTETNDVNEEIWTGIANGTQYYEVTMIPADKLPRLPVPDMIQPCIALDAVVMDKNANMDAKPAAGDQIQVALLYGNERTGAKFAAEAIIPITWHIEPPSLTSSVPAPGTKVRVYYDPNKRDFILDGRMVAGKYSLETVLENNSNAQDPSEARIKLTAQEISVIGTDNTVGTFNAGGYNVNYQKGTTKFTVGKDVSTDTKGNSQTQATAVKITAKTTLEVNSTVPAKINKFTAA